jgi:hypothetical protein
MRIYFYFCSKERNSELFSECSMVRNSKNLFLFLFHGTVQNSEHFIFRRIVRNRIPRVCFYFCSTVQNFENLSLPRNGLEFREFSVPRNSQNSAGTNQCLCQSRLPQNNFYVGNCQPYVGPFHELLFRKVERFLMKGL